MREIGINAIRTSLMKNLLERLSKFPKVTQLVSSGPGSGTVSGLLISTLCCFSMVIVGVRIAKVID